MTDLPFADRIISLDESFARNRAADPIRSSYVFWDAITPQLVTEYEELLQSDPGERPMQAFISEHPIFLVQHLGGGHGRWVIPEKRLGSEYRIDYAVGERDSMGFHWTGVELQSPKAKFFVRSGRTTEDFDEGIRQISEWRTWLTSNLDYARRPPREHGLGLTGIDPLVKGLVVLGRERDVTPEVAESARARVQGMNIEVHTFDWLAREAKRRIRELGPDTVRHAAGWAAKQQEVIDAIDRSEQDPTIAEPGPE